MYYKYGNFQSDDNSAIIGSRQNVLLNRGGQMYARKLQYDVHGYVYGTGQAAITAAMNALITALAKPYQDFIFYQDDGSQSATKLINGTSLSGVTVDGPNFVESRGPFYATEAEYTFTVSAEYPLDNTQNLLISFTETIRRSGGGPRFVWKEALVGPPQKQQVRTHTIYSTIQEGHAVGYRHTPNIPPSLWPAFMVQNRDDDVTSPERHGKGYQDYSVRWKYQHQSGVYLPGVPHLWT